MAPVVATAAIVCFAHLGDLRTQNTLLCTHTRLLHLWRWLWRWRTRRRTRFLRVSDPHIRALVMLQRLRECVGAVFAIQHEACALCLVVVDDTDPRILIEEATTIVPSGPGRSTRTV